MIAALVVIFGHSHPLSGQPDPVIFGNAVQSIAVKIFFVVSGYLVAKSWWSDPNLGRFLMRRGLRLFPALAIVLLLTVLVLGPFFTTIPLSQYFHDAGVRTYFVRNLVLYPIYGLPGVFAENVYPSAVNGSLWSLPAEVSMYLLLPILAVISALSRSRAVFAALVIIGSFLCLHYLVTTAPDSQVVVWGTGSRSVADVGPFFFLGTLFTFGRLERLLNPGFALFMIAGAALFQLPQYWMQQIVLMVVLPYAVLSFCTAATPFLSRAGRFGDPSYGIYLYGFPVQQALFNLAGPTMGPLHNTLYSIPIVLALAYLSWHVFEKRALSFKPRKRPSDSLETAKEVTQS
jgi:peptidoglycan/LPS O-acetylase OafA/YrhL